MENFSAKQTPGSGPRSEAPLVLVYSSRTESLVKEREMTRIQDLPEGTMHRCPKGVRSCIVYILFRGGGRGGTGVAYT